MKIKNWWIIVLIAILIVASIFILFKNYRESVVGAPDEMLNIKVKECCKYIQAGEEKTCSVLEKYSCDYCKRFCS